MPRPDTNPRVPYPPQTAVSSPLRTASRSRPSLRRRAIVLAFAAALGIAGGYIAFQAFRPASSPAGVGGPVALEIGQPAPPLRGTTLDGASLDLASLHGRPVVVNFWASYCIPCRSEFAEFKDAIARHGADGLAIVGVVFNDDASPARTFVREQAASWPSLTDPSGSLAKAYKVVAVPQTYFIDRAGIVRERQIGPVVSDADLEGLLAAVLG